MELELEFDATEIYKLYINDSNCVNRIENGEFHCLNCNAESHLHVPVYMDKNESLISHGKCCTFECMIKFLRTTERVLYYNSLAIILNKMPCLLNLTEY